jgi:hypothetical protein
VATVDVEVLGLLTEHDGKIRDEVLAVEVTVRPGVEGEAMDLDGHQATVKVTRA